MAMVFGSGATLDEGGAIVPARAVSDAPVTPAADMPVGSEPGDVEVPAGDAMTEAVSAEPTSPAAETPVALTESEEAEGEDALVLPPTEKSQRRFVRELIATKAQQEERLAHLNQQHAQQAAQIAQLTALLQQLHQQQQVPPPTPTPSAGPPGVPESAERAAPPQPESFNTHAEYLMALSHWSAEQAAQDAVAKYRVEQEALAKTQREERETQARTAWENERQARWHTRMTEGQQQFADFSTVLANPAAAISDQVKPVVIETVLESPVGAAILHYLGAHPDVTTHLNQMGPLAAAKLMGVIEAHVTPRPEPEKPSAAPAQPRPVVQPALPPAPIAPVAGGQAPTSPTAFRPGMSLAAYSQMRDAQRQARR